MIKRQLFAPTVAAVLCLGLAGCAGQPDAGAFVGGSSGAFIGNRVTGGSFGGTVVGAAVGAAVGAEASRSASTSSAQQ